MTGTNSMLPTIWVGIDWATEEHQICVIDAERNILEQGKVPHRGEELAVLAARLLDGVDGDARRLAVAIERPDGPVVETLLERGIPVFAINPKQLDRFRDRHTVAGAKDDRRDAFVLADSLRTDGPLYRRVRLDSPELIQLREVARLRDEVCRQIVRTTNRLAEQLRRFYPQVLELGALDDAWCWELLDLAPTPAAAHAVRPARIKALLRARRVRRFSADEVLSRLRATPLTVAPGITEAASLHIASLLRLLRSLAAERARCDKALAEQLGVLTGVLPTIDSARSPSTIHKVEHQDVEIILSLPGVGNTVAAALLSEAAGALADRDYQGLRLRCGAAPVTYQTGKQRSRGSANSRRTGPQPKVRMRRASNARLRDATYHMARVAAQRDPHWKLLYANARARGATHGTATRVVADRMLKTLVSMLRNGRLYDPAFFGRIMPGKETP
jgi:transposase